MQGYFLNYFECVLNCDEIKILSFEYDGSKISDYKKEYPNYHFYRDRNSVFYWKKSEEIQYESINDAEATTIQLEKNPNIFAKIIELGIVEWLEKSRKKLCVRRNRYSNTWQIFSKSKDILSNKVDGFKVFKRVQVNTFYNNTKSPQIGVCISINLKNEFTWSKEDWNKNGISTIDLKGNNEEIFPNKQAVKRFTTAKGAEKYVNDVISKNINNSKLYEDINSIYLRIEKNIKDICFTDELRVSNILKRNLPYSNDTFSHDLIDTPTQLYSYGQKAQSGSPEQKIKRYKPVSYELFLQKKTIRIGVLSPKKYQGHVELFSNKIKQKLENIFHIPSVELEYRLISDSLSQTYSENIHEFDLKFIDLVVIILDDDNKKLAFRSPYFICKAKYIGQGIPTQEVLIKNVRSNNIFTLGNIALNIYAKIAGTPWTLKQRDESKNELIVGVGSSLDYNNQTVLGIAQIFQNNGQYIVGECIPLSNLIDYSKRLEKYLKSALELIITESDKNQNDIRIIFHLNKSPSNKYEITAIETVLKYFSDYNIEYSLVKIGFGHNFRLFNNQGKILVEKGLFVKLDDWMGLIAFGGKSSKPLLMNIDHRSKFTDLYYLAEQIFWFSFLSFKSYLGSKRPVTILYPSLMVKMIEDLKNVSGWDKTKLTKVSDKLWFL